MGKWATAHPWMTFFMVGAALSATVVLVRGYEKFPSGGATSAAAASDGPGGAS